MPTEGISSIREDDLPPLNFSTEDRNHSIGNLRIAYDSPNQQETRQIHSNLDRENEIKQRAKIGSKGQRNWIDSQPAEKPNGVFLDENLAKKVTNRRIPTNEVVMVETDTYVYNHSWQSSMDVLRKTKGKEGVNVSGEVFSHVLNPPPFRAREDMRPTQQIPVTTTHVVKVTDADWATVNRERAKNKEPLLTKEEYVRSLISGRVKQCITPEVDTSIVYREGLRPPKDFVDKYNSGQRLDTNEALAFLAQELGPLFNNTRDRSANVPLNIEVERDFANRELIISNTDESRMPINPRFRASLHLKMPNTSGQGNWLPNVASADVHHNGKIYHLDLSRPDHLRVVLEMIRPRHVLPTPGESRNVTPIVQNVPGTSRRVSEGGGNLDARETPSPRQESNNLSYSEVVIGPEADVLRTEITFENAISFRLERHISTLERNAEERASIERPHGESEAEYNQRRLEILDRHSVENSDLLQEELIIHNTIMNATFVRGLDGENLRAQSVFNDEFLDNENYDEFTRARIRTLYSLGIIVPFLDRNSSVEFGQRRNNVSAVIDIDRFNLLNSSQRKQVIELYRSIFTSA